MLKLITWNIQSGRGCDRRVDLGRIVATARAMADFDVLCLQEVARNFPQVTGAGAVDQFQELQELLPGFESVAGVGSDLRAPDGGRRLFGNMVLSRFPVAQAFRHLLPWPADCGVPTMQRVAVEAVLEAPGGCLRVTTTHLEYYSRKQRAAQVERLRELQAEAAGHVNDINHARKEGGPFENAGRSSSGVLTADFNFRADDPLYSRLQAPFDDGAPHYVDSWTIARPGAAQPPTLGLFDHEQWPEAFTCDFIFVTNDLADRIHDVVVDLGTDASDHQPVLLILR